MAIQNAVGFRKWAGDTPVVEWASPEANVVGFGRGNRGFVALNNTGRSVTHSFKTQLSPGDYCNLTSGSKKDGECTGDSFEVNEDGWLTVTIGKYASVMFSTAHKL